jgi:hypothetical protein
MNTGAFKKCVVVGVFCFGPNLFTENLRFGFGHSQTTRVSG